MFLCLFFLNAKSIVHLTTQFQDFKSYAENGTLEDNPVLERSVSLFNGLSQWIQSVVLNRATPSQRADVIAKFVHVAKVRFFDNFNHHNNHRTFLFFYLLRKRNYCQKIILFVWKILFIITLYFVSSRFKLFQQFYFSWETFFAFYTSPYHNRRHHITWNNLISFFLSLCFITSFIKSTLFSMCLYNFHTCFLHSFHFPLFSQLMKKWKRYKKLILFSTRECTYIIHNV